MNRMRFAVSINGAAVCTAALESPGDLVVKVVHVRIVRPVEPVMTVLFEGVAVGEEYERCDLEIEGNTFDPANELHWLRRPLQPGDRVTIAVLPPGPPGDTPTLTPDSGF